MSITLEQQAARRQACELCPNRVEWNADQTAVRCRARGGESRQCARCWARLDAVDVTFGCPVPGQWTYPPPAPRPATQPVQPTPAPQGGLGRVAVYVRNSPQWNANINKCRGGCQHYRDSRPEVCALDGQQCNAHAAQGACPDNKLPYRPGVAPPPRYARLHAPNTAMQPLPALPKAPAWYAAMPDLPPVSETPVGRQDWRNYFGRCFVVNLDRRPDRMDAFTAGLPNDWPLPSVERLPAVDGSRAAIPVGWRAGAGAWGLFRTYCDLIERAIAEGWDRPIVLLEDDAVFVPRFAELFSTAMANVPGDWDAVWIGGQHKAEKYTIAPGVVRAAGPHRTHAFAVHPRFFSTLLRIWQEGFDHVDWCVTRCARKFRIVALDPFLAGQAAGPSDIGTGHARMESWDGRTGRMLADAQTPAVARFNAGAKFGDLVYCLPILRAVGGGHLKFQNRVGNDGYTADAFLRAASPLLELQPYVRSVMAGRYSGPGTIDLEAWRFNGHAKPAGRRLANHYAAEAGVAGVDLDTPWLTVDQPRTVARVIINRTPRYTNPRFPWGRVLEQYAGEIAFVGTPAEHAMFVQAFGSVPHLATSDLLDVARVIAGAELFLGNQSSAYAIAEGLKMNTVQEVCTGNADCLFERGNAIYGWDEGVELPA